MTPTPPTDTKHLPLKFTLTLTGEGGDPVVLCDYLRLNKSDFDPVRAVARTLESTHKETGIASSITLSGRIGSGVRFSLTAEAVLDVPRPVPQLPPLTSCTMSVPPGELILGINAAPTPASEPCPPTS